MDESINFLDSIQSKDYLNQLIGYEIQDPLEIFSEKEKKEDNNSLFLETKELWGIPTISRIPNNTTTPQNQTKTLQKLYILCSFLKKMVMSGVMIWFAKWKMVEKP